jgi:3-oxoadipate enol-lactonase
MNHMMENLAVAKVVLLHSALGDSRLWRRQVDVLRPALDVVAPDLPGWGATPLPAEPFSFVDAVASELPAALVGNSFGGAVALRTALAHQDRVERLVLVGAGLPAWDWTTEMRDYFSAEEDAIDAGDLDTATELNLEFWVAPEHRDEVRPQQRRALELQTEHDEPEVLWPEMAPLSSLQIPTLVIVGADDKADFRAIAHHLAEEIPDADLAIVPGAGHLVGIDQPEELNALLLEFLTEDASVAE